LAGVFTLAIKEIHYVAPWITWLLKWFVDNLMIEVLTYGLWVFFAMSSPLVILRLKHLLMKKRMKKYVHLMSNTHHSSLSKFKTSFEKCF
jgi:hypothetical protein